MLNPYQDKEMGYCKIRYCGKIIALACILLRMSKLASHELKFTRDIIESNSLKKKFPYIGALLKMLTEVVECKEFDLYGFRCKGIFAKWDIPKNTLIWYSHPEDSPQIPFTRKEIMAHPEKDTLIKFAVMVGDDRFVSTLTPDEDLSWYTNHSCEPTIWFDTNEKMVTCRDVKKGEQFVYDYATEEPEPSLTYGMTCKCGSANCRGRLTFGEWRSPAFMNKYQGHTSDLILRKHMENGWYDPRIELRFKADGSLGMFCRDYPECGIKAGEIVIFFAGKIIHKDQLPEIVALLGERWSLKLQFQKNLWQIPAWMENGLVRRETGDYINHSCDPNCGMKDSVTLETIRDISPNEELTFEYAMVSNGGTFAAYNFHCKCGSKNCNIHTPVNNP